MEGTCNCGAVWIKVNDPNLFGSNRRGHICHCTNCKKTAGSDYATNLTIETEKVTITGEENLSVYSDPRTGSGTPVDSPIKSMTPLYKGKTVLKLGIFPQIPNPEWESFVVNRQSWGKPLEGATYYKTKSMGEKVEGGVV
ncbi:hypothetical protein LTR39_001405 [Cryomyces antarcticus]|nr:hypothetical protein LTR39_001405 [Cryomyces antarcticus]